MLRTNKESLVIQAVQGEMIHPNDNVNNTYDGGIKILPVCEAITYNVRVGDSAYGWEADHVEPSVTINNTKKDEQAALVKLSCIGNKAIVMDGKAEGAEGFVTGKHGGGWNVIIDFSKEDMENIAYGDKILIKSWGQGLKLLDYTEIKTMSIDPKLLDKLEIEERDGKIIVPVTAEIPSFLMGSGVAYNRTHSGDIDLITEDKEILKEYKLDKLRLGDFVLMRDTDHRFAHARMDGAVSIGVVIHGDSFIGGHGPGITPIMTCKRELIEGKYDNKANLIKYI